MDHDMQTLFNIIVCICGFLGAFVFYQVMQRLQRSEDKIEAMKEALPKEYVQKGDYKEEMREIKDLLRQIFDKIDSKQDKHQQA